MELTTEASTPTASLRRAVEIVDRLQLPPDVGVNMTGGSDTPAIIDLHPRTHADHECVYRRLVLHDWTREPDWDWAEVQVFGVRVILYDVRGAAA